MNRDVFFLGAGFSRAIIPEYPTLNELSKYIENKFHFEKRSVEQHFMREVPKDYHTNVETLLTYLSSDLPFKTDVQISADQALYKDITGNLANYFIEQMESDKVKLKDVLNKVFPLLDFILKNKCTCITLNYDLLLENLFSEGFEGMLQQFEKFYKMPVNPLHYRYAYSDCLNVSESYSSHQLPQIIKLHGSINWLYSGITPTDPIYCKSFGRHQAEDYLSSDLKTFIVPPVLDKNSQYFNTVLKALWRNAYDKLCEAENIYIYGFSFPPTDLSIRFLFQNAIENNPYANIYVINTKSALDEKNDDFIVKRYSDIFGSEKCNFEYCCDDSLEVFISKIISQ